LVEVTTLSFWATISPGERKNAMCVGVLIRRDLKTDEEKNEPPPALPCLPRLARTYSFFFLGEVKKNGQKLDKKV